MIRTGLGLNLNGEWEERQLTPQLQEIIVKYRWTFDGFRDGLPTLDDVSIVDPLVDPALLSSPLVDPLVNPALIAFPLVDQTLN